MRAAYKKTKKLTRLSPAHEDDRFDHLRHGRILQHFRSVEHKIHKEHFHQKNENRNKESNSQCLDARLFPKNT